MEQFKVFRAIGLSFKAWFANFIPFTLLAGLLYAPTIYLMATMPSIDSVSIDGLEAWVSKFQHATWALLAGSTLLAPLLMHRVIHYMNGNKSSMADSVKHGIRGIVPAVIVAGIVTVVQMVPFGAIVGAIITCYWFVTAPAAVVERLNPVAALGRSNQLTQGRRWGIFGLCILLGLTNVIIMLVYLGPMLTGHIESVEKAKTALEHFMYVFLSMAMVYQLFLGIVQAVSYSLLRADKDGVSNEELAKVFE